MFNYVSNNLEGYEYCEQFFNSPFSSLVDKQIMEREYLPIINVFHKGIEQKIIKNVDMNFLTAFIINPISLLANPRLSPGLKMNEDNLEIAFKMAWDVIKL